MKSKSTSGKYLNMKEATEYIGCSYNTLKHFIDNGLKVIVVGSVKRIARDDIDSFFEAHKI